MENDIQVMQNLTWEQTACMQKENNFSEYTKIESGVQDDCDRTKRPTIIKY